MRSMMHAKERGKANLERKQQLTVGLLIRDVAIWSVLEPSLGIIAGCVATLRPLFKDLGFGRKTTINYHYGSRALRYRKSPGGGGGDGGSSRRSWFNRKASYMQALGDGPLGTHDKSALVGSENFARQQVVWTPPSSNGAETVCPDIEMQPTQQPSPLQTMKVPPRAIISTNIGANPWAEFGERHGISVQRSFHTEVQPRVLAEI